MKINKLVIENDRGIRKLDVALDQKSTVLFGENGTGKTSLLQVINSLYSPFIYKLLGKKSQHSLVTDDISFGEPYTKIQVDVSIEDKNYEYYRKLQRKEERRTHNKETLDQIVRDIKSLLENPAVGTPVFIHYGVHRAVFEVPLRIRHKHDDFDKLVAYENCLHPRTDFKTFFEWYRNQEDIENAQRRENQDYVDIPLRSVQTAIYSFLPEITGLKIRRKPRLQMVVTKNGETLLITQLSDGEKCLLALVGDIARRLAIANPHSDNPLEEKGLVLIDEVELHLHPKWQRHIVPRLQKTFPHIQFIFSTHSPQVLGEIKDMNIFKLIQAKDKGFDVQNMSFMYGKDSNFILEQHMDTKNENIIVAQRMEELFELIENREFTMAKSLYHELCSILTPLDADLVKADILIAKN